MALMGGFWAFLGLIALLDAQQFTLGSDGLLALRSYTSWGWAHLVGGLLAVVAGVAILRNGRRPARVAGIAVAFLSAVVNLGFQVVAPIWTALIIALDVVVIYALTVHGQEIER
jgi:hypothetical protein